MTFPFNVPENAFAAAALAQLEALLVSLGQPALAAKVGVYPIVTLKYSSTTLYQVSYHIQ